MTTASEMKTPSASQASIAWRIRMARSPVGYELQLNGERLATQGGAPIINHFEGVLLLLLSELQCIRGIVELRGGCLIGGDCVGTTAIESGLPSTASKSVARRELCSSDELSSLRDNCDVSQYPAIDLLRNNLDDNGLLYSDDGFVLALSSALSQMHGLSRALPSLLLLGFIDGHEYARTSLLQSSEDLSGDDLASNQVMFETRQKDASFALEYMASATTAVDALITQGESSRLEFKSTSKYDLTEAKLEPKRDPYITRAILKTVAAFLNSDGGTLLIGVSDIGDAIPDYLEVDGMVSMDKLHRRLIDLIRKYLDPPALDRIHLSSSIHQSVEICRVDCDACDSPVFLALGKRQESEFYVRSGPTSLKYEVSEAVKYCLEHFVSVV